MFFVPPLPELLSHIRRHDLLHAGNRLGVAVSGGIDSVALLRLLLELRSDLGIVLSVVHFNHKLRGAESDADQLFVSRLAREHDLEFLCDSDDVAGHASQKRISLEAAARELRYGFFRHLLTLKDTSGAKASDQDQNWNRSGESPAPTFGATQGLKPRGETEPLRGPEGPLFHGGSDGANETRHLYKLDKVVTGHTLDDQAETVLMRSIRGTGLSGLSGIHPRIAVENEEGEVCGEIIRPLLEIRRRELEQYLNEIGQTWREDSSNASHGFTRNRLRHRVIPLLETEFNPSVTQNLAELAEIARGEDEYWDNEVAGWMGTAVHWVEPDWLVKATQNSDLVQISLSANQASSADSGVHARVENAPWLVMNASVSRAWLLTEPIAVQRRVVKAVGEHAGIPLEFKHVEEVLRFAENGSGGAELSLPRGWKVLQRSEELLFVTPDLSGEALPQDYEYEVCWPGEVVIHESGTILQTHRISAEAWSAYNPDELLSAESLSGRLKVRNWKAGDRFWPAHTKSPTKIKELLQEHHVAVPERALWPVVLTGDEIVWVRGFPVHTKYRAQQGTAAVRITERQSG